MSATIAPHDLHRLLLAEHDDPFAILGLHEVGNQLVLRAFRPEAKSLAVLDRRDPSRRFPAERVAEEGVRRLCHLPGTVLRAFYWP